MLSAPAAGNGSGSGSEEDPAAAFLAQQESDIAGIENDEGFSILDGGEVPSSLSDVTGGWSSQSTVKRSKKTTLCRPDPTAHRLLAAEPVAEITGLDAPGLARLAHIT